MKSLQHVYRCIDKKDLTADSYFRTTELILQGLRFFFLIDRPYTYLSLSGQSQWRIGRMYPMGDEKIQVEVIPSIFTLIVSVQNHQWIKIVASCKALLCNSFKIVWKSFYDHFNNILKQIVKFKCTLVWL